MHADKTNRFMLLLLSVVLIAAGAVGLIAGSGALGSVTKHGALSHNRVGAFIGRNGDWLWPVVAVIALVIVVLSLRWLLSLLFSTDRTGDLRYRDGGDVHGRTILSDAAVTSAVTEEIRSYRGVENASARLIGDEQEPTLAVSVTLQSGAELPALRNRIEQQALAHARQATGKPDLPIRLDLAVGNKQPARTR